MTMPRKLLVDVSVTRFYHSISRCGRNVFLCGEGCEHRKPWLEDRLELLAANFAMSVCAFSLMDNHLHVLVRLDPGVADGWSDEEVVRRWIAVYPPRTLEVDDPKTVRMWVEHECQDAKKVAAYRQRLNTSAEFWSDHIRAMFDKQRILGSYFSTTLERLRTLAAERGVHHLDNAVSLADR